MKEEQQRVYTTTERAEMVAAARACAKNAPS
jgi:hypothetical protein